MFYGLEQVNKTTADASPVTATSDVYRQEVLASWGQAESRLKAILAEEDPAGLIFEGDNPGWSHDQSPAI